MVAPLASAKLKLVIGRVVSNTAVVAFIVDDATDVPLAFTDTMDIVYVVVAPNPVMVIGLPLLVPWAPVLVDAMYPDMVPVGGLKLMVTLPLVVLTTAKLVGGFGTELVVTGLDGVELVDVP
jgi:hypothetical protein